MGLSNYNCVKEEESLNFRRTCAKQHCCKNYVYDLTISTLCDLFYQIKFLLSGSNRAVLEGYAIHIEAF